MSFQPAASSMSLFGKGAVVVAALSLSACATHRPIDSGGKPLTAAQSHVLQALDGNGVNQQDKRVQVVKLCTSEPCDVDVKLSGVVTPTAGPGFECNIGLSADTVAFFRPVRKLSWTLKTAGDSTNEFRFRQPPKSGDSLFGIAVYADPTYKLYSLSLTADRAELTGQGDLQVGGFFYGVYLDWRPKQGGEWQACNALDPIFINMP